MPRIARLMAIAIHCDKLIRDGIVVDQSELARLGHVTTARMTQIMVLLNLAPDIQEQLLELPRTEQGRNVMKERDVRPIAASPTRLLNDEGILNAGVAANRSVARGYFATRETGRFGSES